MFARLKYVHQRLQKVKKAAFGSGLFPIEFMYSNGLMIPGKSSFTRGYTP
jgi:hypothetical protein